MKWLTSAPSNIALIKYMGKQSEAVNLPANASFSYTLDNLRSFVEIELNNNSHVDIWQPLSIEAAPYVPDLSITAQQRYLKHLQLIKQKFNISQNFVVRSANNFPAGCGIASSAASFAALTLCAVKAFTELTHAKPLTALEIANISRLGSGSSCRSLLGAFVLWEGESIQDVTVPYKNLLHQVVVVSKEHKTISSSQAHQLVASSLLYEGRPQRAELRLKQLLAAFNQQNWQLAYTIVWQEFWDMHALFATSQQPFHYLQPATMQVLDYLYTYWENNNDGPLVTLDAGPNVHLLFRPDQKLLAESIKNDLGKLFTIL